MKLSINIDHVATLRNARNTYYPSITKAARVAEESGADIITCHLREDRRHIRDQDLYDIKETISIPLNLEIAATDEMQKIALKIKPDYICLVPEKRNEITTEGGMNVKELYNHLKHYIKPLIENGISISLFIDPDIENINICNDIGVDIIELHSGKFAEIYNTDNKYKLEEELLLLSQCSNHAQKLKLLSDIGHGICFNHLELIKTIPNINTCHIGHSIIADSIFCGLDKAVEKTAKKIKQQ